MTTTTHGAVERRIRFGDWLIPYDDATQEVSVERSLRDVLMATPGDHTRCMNSLCIQAHARSGVFPHDVLLVSTIESRVYVVDRLGEDGQPAHAVRYELSKRDSQLIKEHDRYGAGEPGTLRLRVPRDPKGSPKRAKSPAGRFGAGGGNGSSPGSAYSGKSNRPVTSASLGAARRFKVAVGALHPDGDNH